MMSTPDQTRTILIVEDSDEDYTAFQRVLKQCNIVNPVRRFSNGREALDFLFNRGAYLGTNSPPPPWLIILDLNLPGMAGDEILRVIKADPKLGIIPVVMLTTSTHDDDMKRCYASTANSYLTKPIDFQEFKEIVSKCVSYWLGINRLPVSRR